MDVSARPATADDTAAVAQLVAAARSAVADERGGDAWLATEAPEAPGPAQASDGRSWFLACVDEVPLGVLAASPRRWPDGRLVLRIELVWVEPGAREVGLGEALVDAVLAEAAATGAYAVEGLALPGQRELKNLFERVGLVARAIVSHKRVEPRP